MTPPDSTPEDAPANPLTPLEQTAAAAHEVYLAYVGAGFTPKQALYLVGQHARGARHAR